MTSQKTWWDEKTFLRITGGCIVLTDMSEPNSVFIKHWSMHLKKLDSGLGMYVTQLIKYLPHMQEALGSVPGTTETGYDETSLES